MAAGALIDLVSHVLRPLGFARVSLVVELVPDEERGHSRYSEKAIGYIIPKIVDKPLQQLKFQTSGWFLVRVIAENKKTFRFASTAPYFVEIGKTRRRISKTSARFFMNWVKERVSRVKLEDPAQRREVLSYHARAKDFWQAIAAKANVE